MQFSVGRSGKFNEFLTTFLKCLSVDRIEYVETGIRSRPTRPKTPRSVTGSFSVAARTCAQTSPAPARSTKTGSSRAACTIWKWDLKTGALSFTAGHAIRSSKIDDVTDPVLQEASLTLGSLIARYTGMTSNL